MVDAQQALRHMHRYVDDLDWDALEQGVAAAGAVARFCRDRPWVLVATGGALSAAGAVFAWIDRRAAMEGAPHGGHRPVWQRRGTRFDRGGHDDFDGDDGNGDHGGGGGGLRVDPDYMPAP